ncbi:MAG: hypothetical protein H6713_00560 [Myxococcales bacterium]|nr:hypothetical protein [Myxococcales bacterium]
MARTPELGAAASRSSTPRSGARRAPISRERARLLSLGIASVMMLAGIWLISAPMRARRRAAADATARAAATTSAATARALGVDASASPQE